MLKIIINWGIVLVAIALTTSSAGASQGTPIKSTTIQPPPSPMGLCPMGMRCLR